MSRRHRWSIRTRLAVGAGLVMGLICLAASALVLLGVRQMAFGYQQERLITSTLNLANHIQEGDVPKPLTTTEPPAVQVIDPQGRIVSATPRVIGEPPIAALPQGHRYHDLRGQWRRCDVPGFPRQCMIVIGYRVHNPNGDWTVYAADDDVPWYVDVRLLGALAGTSLLLAGVMTAGTYRTVRKTLAPVDAIRAELDEISTTDLGRRVPVPPYQDEIRRMAESVNRTLDRLETLVEKQRRFASDASHDLRSPITAMRTQVEDALLHPGDTDWIQLSRTQLGSLERLEALVSDLLMLARLDAGAPSRRDRLDLSELVRGELDRRRRRVRVVPRLQGGVEVLGDRLRLARLLTNLVDNAERHAASEIVVTVKSEDGTAVLEVLDDGSGIPEEQREVVFQRFTRLAAARNRDAGGTGLGLPIAREIAEEHGGTLTVRDSPSGARFVARFPSARA
ncbi:HAMP domain-containing sensor histidine kinase [Spongiactinospora sp. TRM90649]|uniref:sensor histidine kinase n=1 Tax=Spongiactinospora sp. TRM90649 TaxID=3031114 RepID=UPI0023F9579A|nr:HAMP domain-containing sensor histidine kinase [Spongiactinospora sp. TRM90649]MDF5758107.1 HAMP domain-containing sensor histidine kinase [Spongiactinospora sp. TRM90649]